MNFKKVIKKGFYLLIAAKWRMAHSRVHKKEINKSVSVTGLKLVKQEGEDAFIKKWKPIYKNVNVDYYRYYSHYIGCSPDIVSDDIFHSVIEPVLNNQTVMSIYSDKNMLEKLLDPSSLPVCVLRKMEGDYMDKDYHILHMNDSLFDQMILKNGHLLKLGRIIVKPSVATGGGAGVRLFKYENGKWMSNDGLQLSLTLLEKQYKSNIIIQECIQPSEFVKQFNPTSYSTFRIITYRSVIDDEPHIIGSYMRVGATGSFKDNTHEGGYTCPIHPDGSLADFAGNINREKFDSINGVSLKDKVFKIPNWDQIKGLVCKEARINVTNRLMSFDILLDKDETPRIIEINIKHQTITGVQTLQHPFFGKYTDEVIEYCSNHRNKICFPSCIRIE